MNVRIEKASKEHIPVLVAGMSPTAINELDKRYPNHSTESILDLAFQMASEAYVCFYGEDMVCAIGVNSSGLLASVGHPWMIPHKNINKHKWVFLGGCRNWIKYLLTKYESLENNVTAGNKRAVKWLKWLGFTVGPVTDINGLKCHPYRIKRA